MYRSMAYCLLGLLFAVPVWGQSACSFHLDIQLQEKHILDRFPRIGIY